MACTIPTIISASLDTVLRKVGNVLLLERRGDVDTGEIWKVKYILYTSKLPYSAKVLLEAYTNVDVQIFDELPHSQKISKISL